ncbi:MAG TPA: xanthine dehydrogenase family protein molybdopterin-binding subunit [Burkholderiales bacterium]|nr:xanthine dehydrogenase family protein molybdopterin-binding subunit [Burkholderiales bacterium]
MIENVSRREFFKTSGALVIAVTIPAARAQEKSILETNAFVRIGADSTVTVIVKHLEMGQGTYTGLPTLVAEELDADWAQMRAEGAPADAKRYNNLFWGEAQGTGGSSSLPNSYEQLRKAGAAARFMLVAAAAERWKVPAKDVTITRGVVEHKKSRRRAKFGELVAAAATQVVPMDVPLKDPKDFVYIGKAPLTRTDARAKSNGSAIYTQDVKLPGMLTAVVLHPPRFGAKLKTFDAAKTRQIPGVVNVVPFATPATNGVAVLARDYWTAKKGRDALIAEWDETGALRLGSGEIMAEYKRLAITPGSVAHKTGDIEAALKGAAKTLEAAYEFPYLAHASMEPMNCVVALTAAGCEIWNGEQFQTVDQMQVAQVVDLKPEQVKLNMLYAGGSFGRRANPQSDYLLEAAAIAKASGGQAPVKLVWGREDDMRAGHYRPMYYHALEAGLDAKDELMAWRHTIVGQSILAGTAFEPMMVKNGIDATSVEGAANLPYAVPNRLLELHSPKLAVPVQWWRSVGSTHTAYATECFLDDIARATGKDPLALRLALLANHPRHRGVLELAAKQAGWGKPLSKDRARGVAVHESFGTFVAQVVEVSRRKDAVHIERVVCAVDCGVAVNPNIVAMQMESGIGYGLSAALAGAITLKDGVVEQSNFHDYPVVRMNQMPKIEVHIVPSTEKPSGVGEPGTPVIAPALANALAALNGTAVRVLPMKDVNFA